MKKSTFFNQFFTPLNQHIHLDSTNIGYLRLNLFAQPATQKRNIAGDPISRLEHAKTPGKKTFIFS
jgi:hypothetical protein